MAAAVSSLLAYDHDERARSERRYPHRKGRQSGCGSDAGLPTCIRERSGRLRCARSGMERALRACRAEHATVPELQLALALVQSLPCRSAGGRRAAARDRHSAARWAARLGVAARQRACRRCQDALVDGRARQPVRRRLSIDDADDAEAILRAAWKFIVAQSGADVVLLRKVRADAAIAPLLSANGAIATEKLEAPYLDLASAPSFAEYEKRYSSGSRRNRKRQRRRLEERGTVDIEACTQGARASELARIAIDLKRAWLSERGLVSAAFADNRIADFFADVAGGAVRPADCRVLAMRCGRCSGCARDRPRLQGPCGDPCDRLRPRL